MNQFLFPKTFFTKFALTLLSGAFFILLGNMTYAQKRQVLSDEDLITEEVSKEITALLQSDSFIKKKAKKFKDVKGYIVVDIAIVQQGKLASFFKVDSDIKDIDFLEFLADTLLAQKFNFKLPKQQRYKIRQTLQF
ncbi:MAG: hypothetical protein EOO99_07565 [Pedobacter sp.]|nr:MAG: hypothetical protein EOO99_07565 [Pedobacter sp.]